MLPGMIGALVILALLTLGPAEIRSKLLTSEDKYNAHKTLAFCCLLSFLHRFAQAGVADMAFGSADTPLVLLLHLLLSISSLPFHIPEKRIASGDRIWPEYRLHSITFAARSLAMMALTWAEKIAEVQAPYYAGNALIVLATMALADFFSRSISPSSRTRSIRDLGVAPGVKTFFSMMQMYATAACVIGIRRFSTQYFFVFVVQITAFFLTLRRKNLLSHTAVVCAYASILLMSAAVVAYEHVIAAPQGSVNLLLMLVTVGNACGVLRIGAGLDKYALWTACAGAVQCLRHTTAPGHEEGALLWPAASLLSCLGLVTLCFEKSKGAAAGSSSSAKGHASSASKSRLS